MGLRVPVSVLLAMLCAVACEDNPAITSTSTAPTTTQNFSDTIGVNGGKTYQFSSTARGTVTATLTSLVPEGTVIGLSVGTWNGLFCQQVWVKDDATQGAAVSGTVSGVGNLCLRMYDSGQLTQPATYSVDVTHP
jgi:hypothetical protein